jgi:hypothetical protein
LTFVCTLKNSKLKSHNVGSVETLASDKWCMQKKKKKKIFLEDIGIAFLTSTWRNSDPHPCTRIQIRQN